MICPRPHRVCGEQLVSGIEFQAPTLGFRRLHHASHAQLTWYVNKYLLLNVIWKQDLRSGINEVKDTIFQWLEWEHNLGFLSCPTLLRTKQNQKPVIKITSTPYSCVDTADKAAIDTIYDLILLPYWRQKIWFPLTIKSLYMARSYPYNRYRLHLCQAQRWNPHGFQSEQDQVPRAICQAACSTNL